jgi:hypothetical protein
VLAYLKVNFIRITRLLFSSFSYITNEERKKGGLINEVRLHFSRSKVGEFKIEGNIIPHLWYKNITFPSGKAHFVVITLLADILYWYRPTLVRDKSGDVIGTRTKFKGDILQKSYQAFADIYGFTKRKEEIQTS